MWFWLSIGLLSTVLVGFESPIFGLVLSVLLGASFGLGFPACQAFLTESTNIDSRGRVAGIVIFVTFVIVVCTLLLVTFLELAMFELILICVVLKGTGFAALPLRGMGLHA